MVSLDIVSLYLSIDPPKVCNNICDDIEPIEDIEDDMKLIRKRALNMIIRNNYFTFNSTYYKQNHGATIGAPVVSHISDLLAEYTIRPLQTKVFRTFQITPHI